MINLLQIQDDLKNFSEDQLVREMQQPSGTAPQFLVLSELNRRKRVKGEFAARQAQQAPTVAEEVVASAGVPQSGMMGMSEAMAPASVDSGGIGAMMPQNMKSGGVIRAQSGLPEDQFEDFDYDAVNTLGDPIDDSTGLTPKLNLTSMDDDVLDIEQELRNRQASIESDRDFARNMALVQAGLGILASDKPTLAQAVGEGGQQGLTAFTDANKAYQEGLTDVLNARSKLQQARIKASGKGTLDRKGALAALSSYNNDIAAIRKQISDINEAAYNNPTDEQKVEIAGLMEELKRLRFEQSQLYDSAGIRPRPRIKVADLPSSTKSG